MNQIYNTKKFSLVIVTTNIDFISVITPFCPICLCNKLNVRILTKFTLEKNELSELKRNNIRFVNVICECTNK